MIAVIISIIIAGILSIIWGNAIVNMKEKHTDYPGNDFL